MLWLFYVYVGGGQRMEFSHLAILLTENCNAHCKMCCDSRGIVRGKTLTERELDKILNDVKECKQITDIGITGGELCYILR